MTGGASEIADPSDYIGKYVKQFESGSKGSRMISKGTGDYGGVSFGTYQFPSYKKAVTTSGKLAEFWNKFLKMHGLRQLIQILTNSLRMSMILKHLSIPQL